MRPQRSGLSGLWRAGRLADVFPRARFIVTWLFFLGSVGGALISPSSLTAEDNFNSTSDKKLLPATRRPPVGHWTFDEKGGRTVADSSGNGNDGALHDFPRDDGHWVRGRVGGALNFNTAAGNNAVKIPDNFMLNFTKHGAFSISVWVRSKGQPYPNGGIVCKGFGAGGEQFALDAYGQQFRFFVRDSDGVPVVTPTSSWDWDGNWQHLVATYDRAGIMALYANGELVGSNINPPLTLLESAEPITIGSRKSTRDSAYDLPFNGCIDDARWYDYALDATEVRRLYSSVDEFLPVLTVEPEKIKLWQGNRVIFSALADGTEPLRYQWFKNGGLLVGQTNPTLGFANLLLGDDGEYTAQVTDARGVVAAANARLSVIPFFWQTWWFRMLPLPLLIVAVALTVHLVEKRKTRIALEKVERGHAVDRERMRIARDMHDEIGAKLSRISFLSDLARRGVTVDSIAGRRIDEVSDAAREIIQTVDEIVWAVNPRNDTLESLVHYICRHAEEFFEMTPVELELELPEIFPPHQFSAEVRHNLFCATKEILSNALKHAGATKVRISFPVSEAAFRIRVKDNGRGFVPLANPPEEMLNGNQVRNRRGSGLVNIRERLKNVHGEATLESVPGQGTTVILNVLLKSERVANSVGADVRRL